MTAVPKGLGLGGAKLWRGVVGEQSDLSASQLATLEGACRQRDRADLLAENAAGGDLAAIRNEREASLAMARLIAALRLPDPESGKRAQGRQLRGVQKPSVVTAADFRSAARRSG